MMATMYKGSTRRDLAPESQPPAPLISAFSDPKQFADSYRNWYIKHHHSLDAWLQSCHQEFGPSGFENPEWKKLSTEAWVEAYAQWYGQVFLNYNHQIQKAREVQPEPSSRQPRIDWINKQSRGPSRRKVEHSRGDSGGYPSSGWWPDTSSARATDPTQGSGGHAASDSRAPDEAVGRSAHFMTVESGGQQVEVSMPQSYHPGTHENRDGSVTGIVGPHGPIIVHKSSREVAGGRGSAMSAEERVREHEITNGHAIEL
jgi:hypothetical protein